MSEITLSQEESLVLYGKARARALENNRFVVGRHQMDLPEDMKDILIKEWIRLGWFIPAVNFLGAPGYLLPEVYRSYAPGEERIMAPGEKSELLSITLSCLKPDGSIRVGDIPTRGLWRLIDAEIIHVNQSREYKKYILDPAYR